MRKIISFRFLISVFLCSFLLLFASNHSFAQNLRVMDEIGGGNNSTTDPESSTDNTFIYVAAGLVIGGLVAYALLRDKSKPETDTTSVSSIIEQNLLLSDTQNFNTEVLMAKEKIPVDLYFGVRNEDAIIPDKTYLVGLSLKF